ncbi:unnamed protein product [Kuraishia capsulata CBS 1993]|uniref:BHLH domain-containing protein n=1 Tax=Kuraishia capsulata CBS 1993 TaxID=1382522 RepID=W6MKY9_9ASCO|nr:uncharacterized protein KUCA_T00001412001 [Kuraishia capsulata CBS 1993]CDK25442.1 unnamed protein product [Kuraishia capsulata CBS 1993]
MPQDSDQSQSPEGTGSNSHLTAEQKKLHHLQSEHKRREQIRATYDQLVSLVPSLKPSENRSELAVLSKSTDYIRLLRKENQELLALAKERNINIPEELLAKIRNPTPQ